MHSNGDGDCTVGKNNFIVFYFTQEMHLVGDCECTVSKNKEGRLEHMKLVHGYKDGDQVCATYEKNNKS